MSHFTTIQTEIKDIPALRSACAELQLEIRDGIAARGFNGKELKGDHVIRLNGPYDIAINRETSGVFSLATDWWDGHVEREVGKGYGKLLQLYGVHKAIREARRRGYRVTRENQPNGNIQLTVQGA